MASEQEASIDVKPSELKTTIIQFAKNKWPLLVQGSPGIGKTEIIKQCAKELNANLIISHPVVSDPTDYKGIPFVVDGKAVFLAFNDLEHLINPEDKDQLTMYFCDDIGQAPQMVQGALMQLFLERRINGHMVSDNVMFIAATNRRTDGAAVGRMIEPLKSRFVSIVNLVVDTSEWLKWARANNVNQMVRQFIRWRTSQLDNFHPTTDLQQTSSPRTVHHVSKLMDNQTLVGNRELLGKLVYGAAGEEFQTEFMPFINIWKSLPNPHQVYMKPDKWKVDYEPDVMFALTGALADMVTPVNIEALTIYLDRMYEAGQGEMAVKCMTEAMDVNPEIVNTAAWSDWAEKNNEFLGGA